MFLFPLHICLILLLVTEFWIESSFFITLNMCYFFLASNFLMRNSQSFKLLFPCKQYISLATFKIFLFHLVFSNLITMSLCVWISLSLPIWWFAELLESVHLCVLSNLGEFKLLFFKYVFMHHTFSPVLGTLMIQILDILLLFVRSLRLCSLSF